MSNWSKLADWAEIGKSYHLFEINERWGIRDHTMPSRNPPVLVHRCESGMIAHIHDLKRYNFKCRECMVPVPEEVQAVWLLGTWNYDERWMK